MKNRISHFTTKNIEINEITRPSVKKHLVSQKSSKEVQKTPVEQKPHRYVCEGQLMRKAIAKEAVHAVHPVVPSQDALIASIKKEAISFREVYIQWKPKVRADHTVELAYERIIKSGFVLQ